MHWCGQTQEHVHSAAAAAGAERSQGQQGRLVQQQRRASEFLQRAACMHTMVGEMWMHTMAGEMWMGHRS